MITKTEINPQSAHQDRVAQVYCGIIKWGDSGKILRQRIDWMADQTQGPRILDVGCSEGILEIILARKGFNVTGVDINAEALAFARGLLAREPEEVRSRVRFVHGDLAQARLLDDRFDTLVMGEILEHLEDPQTLLNRSLDLIRPDGRVIITTPFGYHPDEDHRQTFCLSDFIALAKPRCALEHLQVESGYIHMVGRVSSSTESSWQQLDSDQLLSMTETALVSSQQRLYGNISGHKRRVNSLEQRVKEGNDREAKLQKDVKEESSKATRLWQEAEERKSREAKLWQEVEDRKAKVSELLQELDAGRAKTAELQQELDAGKAKASELLQELDAGKAKTAKLQQELDAGRARTADLLQELDAGRVKTADLLQELDAGKARTAKLQQELDAGRAKTAELLQELDAGKAKTAELQQELDAGRAKTAELQQELDAGRVKTAELQQELDAGKAKTAELLQELDAGKAKASKLQRELKKAREWEVKLRRSIRWQLGTLFVEAARRPWRVVRLPLDLTRLAVVAFSRRYSVSSNNVSTRNPSHPSPPMTENRGNMRGARARPGRRTDVPTATSLLSPGSSSKQMVDWITDQVEGRRVAVVGCDNTALLDSLDQLRFNVSVYQLDSWVSEPVLVKREVSARSQEEPGRSMVTEYSIPEAEGTVGSSGKADSVIICGMLRAGTESEAILNCVRDRLSQPAAKVIVVQPRFNAIPRNGTESDLTSLLTALRTPTVPEYLSLANGSLRFVGRFNRASSNTWSQFESGVWPQLIHEVVESIQHRKSREISALEQRVQDVLESTSYRAGQILVTSAKEPRTLWKAPLRLWQLYRSSWVRTRQSNVGPSPSGLAPTVDIPALKTPPTRSEGAPVVAAILDTFTEYCLRYEADLVLLTPKQWKRQLERAQPAFLLVESAWSGNNGEWRYLLTNYKSRDVNPLRDLVKHCREHELTTVFWNKEDPPNFDVFIDVAKEFDFVFTTDVDSISKYKEICGHDRVYLMAFACQARLHNPCREKSWPRYPVCFAGSWMEKYSERRRSLDDLLEPALAFGLHIFDRNFKVTGYDSRYRFPDRYQSAIKGSLDYEHMLTAYRCYDVMMNVNTVTDSATMFSRRVFESLACGTPVISTDSVGLEATLGGYVRITRNSQDTTSHLNELLADEERRMREGHLGYRYVHTHHTYRHRMKEMFLEVGVESGDSARKPSVSVVIATCRPDNVKFAIENYKKQVYAEKELLLILNNAIFDVESIEAQARDLNNVRIVQVDGGVTLGESLNRGVEEASGYYIAKMDDDDYYGENYLSDMMLAADFSGAEILGKGTYFVHMKAGNITALRSVASQHEFTDFVAGATLTGRREVLREIRFPDCTRGEDSSLLAKASKAGCRIYSADAFNMLVVRGTDHQRHTWDIGDSDFLKNCRNIRSGLEWARVMI